jgi:hypothetical protein
MEEDSWKRPSIVQIIHELNKTEIGIDKVIKMYLVLGESSSVKP